MNFLTRINLDLIKTNDDTEGSRNVTLTDVIATVNSLKKGKFKVGETFL